MYEQERVRRLKKESLLCWNIKSCNVGSFHGNEQRKDNNGEQYPPHWIIKSIGNIWLAFQVNQFQ